ncbi:AAA ATPase [Flavobacterium cauense R2A-7]|uniref:Nucleoside-triphosphatase THEP1 n=1 Tax=Flavobacterium cauense R2A-7 TaxID=1341154 RepID=V6S0K0_9FLAO|nr:AAA family ATPase [Flavobacterium cauense]ESU19934.1 AAA ATPase [Flavobacterium cauense R2A-7]KGO83740.1 ATPase AAA [Flavobacterium cauense R2A-7]TWI12355.1 nucleoside-triphosphatase THEP1 [Flavobacterium cauense R2A-7]
MELKKSERSKAKIKMALQGPSGSGKTTSAILLAQGLTNGNLSKVAIIDSENGSANLYSHLGDYNVLSLDTPHSPERYIQAIDVCLAAGMEVIILDSISHCWDYLLDYHSSLAGNSFANWAKIKPLEKAFVNKILQSDVHFIATMRVKQDYVLSEKNGKMVPEKVGLKAIQRDEISYEFTIVFDIDSKHFATASKDRTLLFEGKPQFIINSQTGKKILDWCNSTLTKEQLKVMITECNNMNELTELYHNNFDIAKTIEQDFVAKRDLLQKLTSNITSNGNGTSNGTARLQ